MTSPSGLGPTFPALASAQCRCFGTNYYTSFSISFQTQNASRRCRDTFTPRGSASSMCAQTISRICNAVSDRGTHSTAHHLYSTRCPVPAPRFPPVGRPSVGLLQRYLNDLNSSLYLASRNPSSQARPLHQWYVYVPPNRHVYPQLGSLTGTVRGGCLSGSLAQNVSKYVHELPHVPLPSNQVVTAKEPSVGSDDMLAG